MGFSFHYSKILLAKCPKIESSFLGLPERILLFSAMVKSSLPTFSSFYFPRVREINWLFQDLCKNDSQYTSGETPTTYFQSLNGWFNTVSVEFAFSWSYPFPWIHDLQSQKTLLKDIYREYKSIVVQVFKRFFMNYVFDYPCD